MTLPPTFSTNTALSNSAPSDNCVLIVDDEPGVLAVGKAILSSASFDVVCAQSGDEAVELVRKAHKRGQHFAAVILDLTMPGGPSGFDVLSMMTEIDPSISVVACSGFFQSDARELCRALGFYDVLAKPYNVEALNTIVRRAIVRAPDPSNAEEPALSTIQAAF